MGKAENLTRNLYGLLKISAGDGQKRYFNRKVARAGAEPLLFG